MQNATVTLTADQMATRNMMLARCGAFLGARVEVHYVKRDNTPAVMVGEVVEVLTGATPDKGCVRVLTADGFKSANLWRVSSVQSACYCGLTNPDHTDADCRTMMAEVAAKDAARGW